MKILHTIPGRNWGGMEHRTIEQVKWLVAHGHDVWLATPGDGQSFAKAQGLGLPVLPANFDPPWAPANILALRRLVKHLSIDVIDAHYTRDAKCALACLDLCALVRSRHVNQYLKPGRVRAAQWHAADHIITVAECTRQDMIRDGLIPADRSVSIGGWADERFFDLADPVATRATLRGQIGLADTEFTALCVAMLRPDKGQNFLIDACRLLKQQGKDLTLVFAGEPTSESTDYAAQIQAQCRDLAVKSHFLGYRDDISALMQAADLVVIPSLTEAQPRVAVQAFATGRPVVASRVGGVPEIVIQDQTGWLVPSADPNALAAAIATIMDQPDLAQKLAAGARAMAETRMRFDHRMAETLAVYQTAIRRSKIRPWIKARP